MANTKVNIFRKLLGVLRYEKEEISSIYVYAIFSGLVQLSLPLGIQSIISFVLGGSISTSLVLLIIFVLFGVFIAGLLQVNQMKLIEKIQQQLFVRYSFYYAHTIPNLSLKDIDQYYLPEMVNRFFDTVSLQKGISKLLLDIPAATIQILFGLILLSFYHPVFILFGLLLVVVLYFILRITGYRGMQTSIEESNYKYKVAGYLEELARVVTTLKFSRNTSMHVRRTDEYVSGYLKSRTAHFRILLFQYWTLIGFKVAITSAMLIIGAILLVNQQLNIGQFIASEIVILMVIGSVEKVIVNLDKVYDVLTSVEKVNKLLEKPVEPNGSVSLDTSRGISVKAQNLSFSFVPGQEILKKLDFEIGAGQTICICGANASGKSTLLRLITGAYPITSGSLLINDIPIHHYDINSIRSEVGILLHFQEIFQGTLMENICMGDDQVSYHQLDRLAMMVGLKPFIDAQQEGYQVMLQPQGQHLSTRIINKILLMRALIHHPKLLLLEEPWLLLEEPYRKQLQDYLLQLKDTTTIIVTNDMEFKSKTDKVIVMEAGSIQSIISN